MTRRPPVCYTVGMRHDPARVLSLRVPPDLRPRLDSIARDRGTSRHRAAVEALTAGLDVIERPASPVAPAPEAA